MHPFRKSLALALLFVGAAIFHRPFRQFVLAIVRFPLVVVHAIFSGLVWLPALPSLHQENLSLRHELTVSRLAVAQLQESLRHLTASQERLHGVGSSGTVASIIARGLVPTDHVVLIDRGSKNGIVPHAIVVDAEGLVGRILEVQPTTSAAMLLTDPDSRVGVLVERSRESGLLVGTGGPLLHVGYLDLDADVEVNDRVVTAGLGGPFPKGLLVGTIVRIERDERRASTTAWVHPSVKFSRLEEVVCLPPASSP